MSEVRWAIIGTGGMADTIASAIEAEPGTRLALVVGRTRDGAARFAASHAALAATSSVSAALAGEFGPLDAVYIGSPNALHGSHARAALMAGKHVLADKPLTTDVTEAKELIALAARERRVLAVNLQNRHQPVMRELRDLLAAGSFGRLVSLDVRLAFGNEDLIGWRADERQATAGALYNLGVHAVDTALFLGGEIDAIGGFRAPSGHALDRTTRAHIRFRSGALGSVLVSQESCCDNVGIELVGTAGRASWSGWMAPYRNGVLLIEHPGGRSERRETACPDAYARVLHAFTEAIRGRAPGIPDPAGLLATVNATEAIRAGRAA